MQNCEKLERSRGARISNRQDLDAYRQRSLEFDSVPMPSYWFSATDAGSEGDWVDWHSGDKLEIADIHVAGKTTGVVPDNPSRNCGIFSTTWVNWLDYLCKITPAQKFHCMCEKEVPVYLRMRGLCPKTNIDTFWIPQNADGKLFFRGIENSRIDFVKDLSREGWEISVEQSVRGTSAFSMATLHSFLLGKSTWIVSNDGKYAALLAFKAM